MAYFIMEGVRKDKNLSEEEFLPLLKGHQALIARGVAEGRILLAGPRIDSPGGFTLIRAENRAQAEAFFQEDPFKINDLQDYLFKELEIHEHHSCIEPWLAL